MHATSINLGLKVNIRVAMRETTTHRVKQARIILILIRIFIEFHSCSGEQVTTFLLARVVFIDILIEIGLRLAILERLLAE
jgi:hypothetical protein